MMSGQYAGRAPPRSGGGRGLGRLAPDAMCGSAGPETKNNGGILLLIYPADFIADPAIKRRLGHADFTGVV